MKSKIRTSKIDSITIQTWGDYEFKLFPGSKSTKPYVHFLFADPITGEKKRERKMMGLKPGSSISILKKEAKVLSNILIDLLSSGFNPRQNSFNDLPITPLSPIIDCIAYWLKERAKAVEVKAIGEKALKGNTYLMDFFKEWLTNNQYLYRKAKSFTKIDIDNFLQVTAYNRKWGKVSYNTYRTDLGTFFNHLVTLKIISENPVLQSEKKNTKRDSSRFVIYEEEELSKVVNTLANDKRYLDLYIGAKLVFFLNIRPVEITRIQVHNIDLDKKILTLPPDKTKNGNEAKWQLTDELFELFQNYIGNAPANYFVFGGNNKPKAVQVSKDFLGARWREFRKKHSIPYHLKFYALKHSADHYDIEDGASYDVIQKRNRHANLQITSLYVRERLNRNIIKPANSTRF